MTRETVEYTIPTDMKPWSAIDSTGDTVITTNTVVTIDSVQVANDGYSLADSEITVSQDGLYLVSYSITYDITDTAGGTRGCVGGYMTLDDEVITQSASRVYHREASGGSGLSTSFVVQIDSGQKLKLLAAREYSTTNIDTKAGRSSTSIVKVG